MKTDRRNDETHKTRLIEVLEENADLRQTIAQLRRALLAEVKRANSDPLTGCFNHAGLDQAIANVDSEYGIVMAIDMRYLKHVNDTYDHAAGDKAIKTFAERLTSIIREEDIIARVGGDEFVVVMPGLSPREASQRRWEIKDKLSNVTFKYEDKTLSVGLRFGVAKFSDDVSIKDAIQIADMRERKIRANHRKFEPSRYPT